MDGEQPLRETIARKELYDQRPARLSDAGMGAMQGHAPPAELPTADSQPAPDHTQVEPLALQDRHRVGIDYALTHAEVRQHGKKAYEKVCGAVGEGVHLSANGGAIGLVADANEGWGNHSRLFDGHSATEVTSIKTYLSDRSVACGNYARGAREMIGQHEPQKLHDLSQQLWQIKQEQPDRWAQLRSHLPSSLDDASDAGALKQRLVDEAVMRIPADHVEPVQEYIQQNAVRYPDKYGIDASLAPAEIRAQATMLAAKIRPLAPGVTAHDLRIMAGHAYRLRFPDRVGRVSQLSKDQ